MQKHLLNYLKYDGAHGSVFNANYYNVVKAVCSAASARLMSEMQQKFNYAVCASREGECSEMGETTAPAKRNILFSSVCRSFYSIALCAHFIHLSN